MKWREAILFLLASFFLSLVFYRDALIGHSLLAPLDLGPDIFEHYHFMDPSADGIPDNHYIVDQFTYDLPLQKLIYDSYHQGEIPWWDPYTYGGRPLLADAHINGTDPIRLLCYALLPFELAYNWNYILRGILTGLGMFALLRWLDIRFSLAALFALGYSFAGWMTLYWGHPWIQGSFLYYPFLWIVWASALKGKKMIHCGVAAVLLALIFYAGNLQSHVYVVIFALIFLVACFFRKKATTGPACLVVMGSGLLGAILAAPVLLNQVEFFLNSNRAVSTGSAWWQQLALGPAALAAFYPWMLGSFKTFDLTRAIHASAGSWQLFIGPVIFLLALWQGWTGRKLKGEPGFTWLFALLLLLAFLIILSSPACAFLYARCATLGGMGLVVLGAQGAERLCSGDFPSRKSIQIALLLFTLVALGSSLLAWVVYPSFKAEVRKKMQEEGGKNFTSAPALRALQVESFPKEVSLENPEAALSLLALACFAFFLLARKGKPVPEHILALILLLSLIPVFLFHARFRPKQPIALWEKMKEGGSGQLEAGGATGKFGRLEEYDGRPFNQLIFPNALAALYRVHVVHGYSALQPKSVFLHLWKGDPFPPSWTADVFRKKDVAGGITLQVNDSAGNVRLQQLPKLQSTEPWYFVSESSTTLVARLKPGFSGEWIRTDTFYPGWQISLDDSPLKSEVQPPCFSKFNVGEERREKVLKFEYQPSYLPVGRLAAMLAASVVLLLIFFPLYRAKRMQLGRVALSEGISC